MPPLLPSQFIKLRLNCVTPDTQGNRQLQIYLLAREICGGIAGKVVKIEDVVVTTIESYMDADARNVLGEPLETCCTSPMTGFYRDGCCHTGPDDTGRHVVCAQMTEAFLRYTQAQGNDLSTPMPMYNFPGLKPGDRWCLCASRWQEALQDGVAPPVILAATHEAALQYVSLQDLQEHALGREAPSL